LQIARVLQNALLGNFSELNLKGHSMTNPIILSNETAKPEVNPAPNTQPDQGKPVADTPPAPVTDAPKAK
jgi:hypothetical protein